MKPNSNANRARSLSARSIVPLLAALLAAFLVAPAVQAKSLARQLVEVAPEVVRYMEKKGYRNVGVLKFRIQKGDSELSDRIGTLNSTLADRVENALMLALDAEVANPMGIIDDASAVAATLGNPSYLTQAGRKKLFNHKDYPLRWGNKKVQPDAFVTGVVILPKDRAIMEVALCVFDRDEKFHFFASFEADLTTNLLTESGRDFLILRGANDGEFRAKQRLTNQLALEDSQKQQKKEINTPVLKTKGAPVELIVYYNNQPIPLELGPDNTAKIPEPQEGQKVHFELVRRDTSNTRYGVVLKVNGENTLFKQKLPALQCRKWILDTEQQRTEVHGFQRDEQKRDDFRIASAAESKAMEVNYGRDVGQISLVVFREERIGGPPPDDLPPDEAPVPNNSTQTVLKSSQAKTLLAASFGKAGSNPEEERPNSLLSAQRRIRDDSNNIAPPEQKGLILSGGVSDGRIRTVNFKPDPVPVMSATIIYYKP